MTSAVVKIAGTAAVPVRLEGRVEETPEGHIKITYKEKGLVKAKTRIELPETLAAYQLGDAGFAYVLSNEPVGQFFGTLQKSNDGIVLKTETGKVYINSTVPNTIVTMAEADEDSKEAKLAMRAGKVKAKIKSADGAKKSKKDKGEDGAKKKKKKSKK